MTEAPKRVLPPAIVIRLELENPPRAYVDAIGEGEEIRLAAWIESQPELQALVAAASQAWANMAGSDERGPDTFTH